MGGEDSGGGERGGGDLGGGDLGGGDLGAGGGGLLLGEGGGLLGAACLGGGGRSGRLAFNCRMRETQFPSTTICCVHSRVHSSSDGSSVILAPAMAAPFLAPLELLCTPVLALAYS